MAPELVNTPERINEKADCWSFGMLLWELLTLQSPFQELAPNHIIAGLMVRLFPFTPLTWAPCFALVTEGFYWQTSPCGHLIAVKAQLCLCLSMHIAC